MPIEDRQVVVAVARPDGLTRTTNADTPYGITDVHVKVISPWMRILMRSLRSGAQSLLGSLTGAGIIVGSGLNKDLGLPNADFAIAVKIALFTAAATAGVTMLQNLIEYLTELDQKAPTWVG